MRKKICLLTRTNLSNTKAKNGADHGVVDACRNQLATATGNGKAVALISRYVGITNVASAIGLQHKLST